MQLKRIKITLEDKTDFSGKSEEEISEARKGLAQECINRILVSLVQSGLVDYQIEETENHGLRATATLGVYDIRQMDDIQEEKELPEVKKKTPKS